MSERPQLEVPSSREILDTLLTMPGDLGSSFNRFWNYSPRNVAFLAIQGCPPEPVATYDRWKQMDRQVQKGSKAYSILRPITVRAKQEEGANQSDEEAKMIRRFKVVRALFAYSQTEGEELPEVEPRLWSPERAMGKLAIERVPFAMYDGNTLGYSYRREVAINPTAPDPLPVLLHEIGHIENGHTTSERIKLYREHRGVFEFEAEATSAVCLNGMDELTEARASVARAYAQNWMRTESPSDTSIRSVLNASTRILQAGYEEVTHE